MTLKSDDQYHYSPLVYNKLNNPDEIYCLESLKQLETHSAIFFWNTRRFGMNSDIILESLLKLQHSITELYSCINSKFIPLVYPLFLIKSFLLFLFCKYMYFITTNLFFYY